MIDDQVNGDLRIHLFGVTAHAGHGVTHRGQVHHAGDAGEVLENHAGGLERNIDRTGRLGTPAGDVPDILLTDLETVVLAQGCFEQDSNGSGKPAHRGDTGFLEGLQSVDRRHSRTGIERASGVERVFVS